MPAAKVMKSVQTSEANPDLNSASKAQVDTDLYKSSGGNCKITHWYWHRRSKFKKMYTSRLPWTDCGGCECLALECQGLGRHCLRDNDRERLTPSRLAYIHSTSQIGCCTKQLRRRPTWSSFHDRMRNRQQVKKAVSLTDDDG